MALPPVGKTEQCVLPTRRDHPSVWKESWRLEARPSYEPFYKGRAGSLPEEDWGGDGRNRTDDKGFADPRLNHLATSPSITKA